MKSQKDTAQQENEAELVAAFRKWSGHRNKIHRAATEAIIKAAQLEPGMRILDLASGTGEPALALAEALSPKGEVIATDCSSGILNIAKDIAKEKRVANLKFVTADAHDLPFQDNHFDLVTCRFGIMFFEDCQKALQECRRVLRPKGRIIFMVWSKPEKQDHHLTLRESLNHDSQDLLKELSLAIPYKFAESGRLTSALRKAGFKMVKERNLALLSRFSGTPEDYWEYALETRSAFRPVHEKLNPNQRKEVKRNFLKLARSKYDGQYLNLNIEVVLATGFR